jgi:hypothetical protein
MSSPFPPRLLNPDPADTLPSHSPTLQPPCQGLPRRHDQGLDVQGRPAGLPRLPYHRCYRVPSVFFLFLINESSRKLLHSVISKADSSQLPPQLSPLSPLLSLQSSSTLVSPPRPSSSTPTERPLSPPVSRASPTPSSRPRPTPRLSLTTTPSPDRSSSASDWRRTRSRLLSLLPCRQLRSFFYSLLSGLSLIIFRSIQLNYCTVST